MQLEFLGTGAGQPAKFRNVTSIALRLLDERNAVWLFDVGEGTQHQILKSTIRPRKVEKIFITHMHGDHIFGLPGFLSSRSFQGSDANEPLTIYGPKGIKEFIEVALKVTGSKLTYPLNFVEITQEGIIFEDATFIIETRKLEHNIPSWGYRIVEKDHPGELLVEKLKAMNIPSGPLYGQIKKGATITLPNGQIINGQDFVGKQQKGRIVTILGDTRKHPNALYLAKNADVLVHESTYGKGEGKLARNHYHSTSIQAADIAKKAQVKKLLLTHISARYAGKLALELEKQAQEIFRDVRVVRDFDVIDIPFTKK
ncbi:ribonuclease Z [Weissella beninensis]|uniref:Ribonuclease Z n=1 Tax=Periweissella beninensis TaxID=504936 RepID=A0ABT0VJK8_9LACO|nr:ribonuclease Z [Periweissella beninensis]MBM7544517.1 ribonuclease Z [Periweissella beninensis]MCM2438015.1 ribonuclease Z [Periweissella beninensis]